MPEKIGYVIGVLFCLAMVGLAWFLVYALDDKWLALCIGYISCAIMYRVGGATWPSER